MTEQNVHPQGEPYGLAMGLLHQATALPACVVVHPDNVLWPFTSDTLSLQHFQLLEQASAVLSALKAHQIPVALVVPAKAEQILNKCLKQANITEQFKAVVHYEQGAPVEQQQQLESLQQQDQHTSQQQATAAKMNSSWAEAANKLKAEVGAPWSQMLFFSADPLAIKQANRLGMASIKVPASTGLTVAALRDGLQLFGSKLESDRGY